MGLPTHSEDRPPQRRLHRLAAWALSVLMGFAAIPFEPALAEPLYSLVRIGREQGLPQSTVRTLAIDRRGFLWVGTESGIARYDGYRFAPVVPPFTHGVTTRMFIDRGDRVWVRWYGKPLTLYDPREDRWQLVAGGDDVGVIGTIFDDDEGVVWVTTDVALLRYDATARRLVHVAALRPESDLRYVQQVAEQAAVFRGSIWIRADREVLRVDPHRAGIAQRLPLPAGSAVRLWVHHDGLWLCNDVGLFRLSPDGVRWAPVHTVPSSRITSCEIARDGATWFGTEAAGVWRLHEGSTQRFTPDTPDRSHRLAGAFVSSVREDSRGAMWVVTPGNAHRWTGTRFERFSFSPDSKPANPGGLAAAAWLEDPNGVFWFGSENAGLVGISPYATKALHLVPPSAINAHVRAPVVDDDGAVWMGSNEDGVFQWRAADATWRHHAAAPGDPGRLPTAAVRALLRTRAGELWAASETGDVLSRYDRANDRWERHSTGLPRLIFNLLELPDGSLLIGRDGFVTEFDPRTRRSRHYPVPGAAPVRAALLSRSGRVYFGTHERGVHEFVPGQGFARSWIAELSNLNVFSLYEDRLGFLWIGTWGGGLDRLDASTGTVQVIARADGLRDGTVFGILPGRHDDLWLSTYAGLAHVTGCIVATWPCRPRIESIDARNGLPMDEFDSEAATRGPRGELYFGGYEGLVRFDPDTQERNPRPPRLALSAIQLGDRALIPAEWERDGAVPRLSLPARFGTLRILFSALDMNSSGNSVYEYRIGSQYVWTSLGTRPELTLNELGSGVHRLEIRGTNGDGVWSPTPLVLELHVATPWYRSAFAWTVYAILAALGAWLALRVRERRMRAANARLEATVAERTRELAAANAARDEFYANISHEIRTPLTLLVGTAEALRTAESTPERNVLTDALLRHGDSLRRYVESLITVAHLRSAPRVEWVQEDIVQHLRSAADDFARAAGDIVLRVDATADRCLVRSVPNALDTIFRNLLMNAIRHTPPGGAVVLRIDERADDVAVEIVDSGPGIDPDLLPTLFERGARGAQTPDGGYGIGLHLVRQTVASLGGSIAASNAAGGGARFSVVLPRASPDLALAASAAGHEASPAPTGTEPSPSHEGVATTGRILIVEDHDELRAYLEALLGSAYRVSMAATLAEGIAIARAQVPDLVVCDVLLPDGEGFDLVSALRSELATEHVGIVLLTALADEASRLRGLARQADLYVTKPFLREELLLQVRNLLEQRRRVRRAAARELWQDGARRSAEAQSPGRPSFEARLLAILEKLHADAATDVEAIARRLAMSRKQLERKTRYCFECSPRALLTRYRLDKAAELLARGHRVGEVAERCGFANQTRFGVVFRARYGYPPSQHVARARTSV